MDLQLDLRNVYPDKRKAFCGYLIDKLKSLIEKSGELPQYAKMESYINNSNIIDWITDKNNFISVYDLYRLAVNNLIIKQIDEVDYDIVVNPNENIPNSYTILYPVISLLEYGTLSVRKCGTLTKYIDHIYANMDNYYQEFLLGEDE